MNRARSPLRACGGHAFPAAKRISGFPEVRYRGLAKDTALAFTMFALANCSGRGAGSGRGNVA